MTGDPDVDPAVPTSVEVWHSVRDDWDTKTPKSRRTLALPARCVRAFGYQREQQDKDQVTAGGKWHTTGLVFTSKTGRELDAANVRQAFRRVLNLAGLNPDEWTPRELRHSLVSLLSSNGITTQDIADLCEHSGTAVTERVYRHELRPVLLNGAVVMDRIFNKPDEVRTAVWQLPLAPQMATVAGTNSVHGTVAIGFERVACQRAMTVHRCVAGAPKRRRQC